jgi:hypothetical protein
VHSDPSDPQRLAMVLAALGARSSHPHFSDAGARAAKLAVDLISSRIEGEAIGIFTARHQITREAEGRLPRRLSRTSHRDRHDVAADVVRTGTVATEIAATLNLAGVPPQEHKEFMDIIESYRPLVARSPAREPADVPGLPAEPRPMRMLPRAHPQPAPRTTAPPGRRREEP